MKKINKRETSALLKSLAFTIVLSLCVTGLIACSDKESTEKSFEADPFTSIEGYEEDGLVYMNSSKNNIYSLRRLYRISGLWVFSTIYSKRPFL